MTVAELIVILKRLDPDLVVFLGYESEPLEDYVVSVDSKQLYLC